MMCEATTWGRPPFSAANDKRPGPMHASGSHIASINRPSLRRSPILASRGTARVAEFRISIIE